MNQIKRLKIFLSLIFIFLIEEILEKTEMKKNLDSLYQVDFGSLIIQADAIWQVFNEFNSPLLACTGYVRALS